MQIILLLVLPFVLFFSSLLCFADSAKADTSVRNSVNVSASSGGNNASGGIVTSGESSVHVYSETTVNGQVLEHVDKSLSGNGSININETNGNGVATATTMISAIVGSSSSNIKINSAALKLNTVRHNLAELKNNMNKHIYATSSASSSDVSSMFVDLQGYQATSSTGISTVESASSLSRKVINSIFNFIKHVFSFF